MAARASNGNRSGKSEGTGRKSSPRRTGDRPNPNGRITGGKPTGTPPKK